MKVLCVCLGNICRSPAAEAILTQLAPTVRPDLCIEFDSCGTGAYHIGEKADARMRKACLSRGYSIHSTARQLQPSDFLQFDILLAMDASNAHNMRKILENPKHEKKVKEMIDFCPNIDFSEIPDPYYGGEEGFKLVIDLLEVAGKNFLKSLP